MSCTSKDIDQTLFMSNVAVGSKTGGYDFGLVGNPMQSIMKLVFRLSQDNIVVLEAYKNDGTRLTIGNPDMPIVKVVSWEFKEMEKFTSIKLYPSTSSDRLAKIELTTDRQGLLQFTIPSGEASKTSQSIEVGTGQCVGVFGNADKWIYNLGFATLRPKRQ